MASLMDAPDVLKKIAAYKADEVEALRQDISIQELREIAADLPRPRGFTKAIQSQSGPALICEVKKASPSKGIIRKDFDPVVIARSYAEGGAACLSVLTDGPGFMGSNAIFKQVRGATELPLLRKDFMLDPIQIAESAAMGADCILVIMAMIDDDTAKALMDEAASLGLDALVETHDAAELARAVKLGAKLIGINNRDLRTFDTTLDTFTRLASEVPQDATLIAESGIFTKDDIERLAKHGAQGYLIGESFMRQDDVAGAVRGLLA
ncbi:indole-3-glycerol phosphate synthase TrpC [Hellea balneolensis]|uniref:indole-3-glycerol phosphate synthase TrpC n=1 Tax=Hellea balneolensis TaxID=287478 RepID=UPI001F326976|nr:indole-3-glycerol phosphate synthase TrpC [Hellea balneolensis]